jgi:hypothetical protein
LAAVEVVLDLLLLIIGQAEPVEPVVQHIELFDYEVK